MKPRELLSTLCDGAYSLLDRVEAAERAKSQMEERGLRRLLEPFLRTVLPLFDSGDLLRLHAEAAVAKHGSEAAAARALNVDARTLSGRLRQRGRSAA